MKKQIKTIAIAILLFTGGFLIAQEQEKKYTVKMSLQEANLILYLLDQSTGPHIQVKDSHKLISSQIQQQITADTAEVETPKQ